MVELDSQYWLSEARSVLELEARSKADYKIKPTFATIDWRSRSYHGLIIHTYPEKPSIIRLAMHPDPLESELVEALKEIAPERPILYADDGLELEMIQYLTLLENKLTDLTEKDREYLKHLEIIGL